MTMTVRAGRNYRIADSHPVHGGKVGHCECVNGFPRIVSSKEDDRVTMTCMDNPWLYFGVLVKDIECEV